MKRAARHRWGIAVSARGLTYLRGRTGCWIQVCLACWMRRLIRTVRRRYDVLGQLDTRGAWTVAVCRDDVPGGYRTARTVGPCPRRTA